MLLGTAWLSPQTPLPFEAHQSTPSLRTFPHLMHLPIPNMTFPPTTVLEDTESPPACMSCSSTGASPAASPRDRAATRNWHCQAALAATILRGYSHAQLLTEVRSDKARLFLGQQVTTGPTLPWGNSASRTDTGFCFVSRDRGSWGRRVKTSGNTGEMPLDEVCCCSPKMPGLKAESSGVAI